MLKRKAIKYSAIMCRRRAANCLVAALAPVGLAIFVLMAAPATSCAKADQVYSDPFGGTWRFYNGLWYHYPAHVSSKGSAYPYRPDRVLPRGAYPSPIGPPLGDRPFLPSKLSMLAPVPTMVPANVG